MFIEQPLLANCNWLVLQSSAEGIRKRTPKSTQGTTIIASGMVQSLGFKVYLGLKVLGLGFWALQVLCTGHVIASSEADFG